MADSKKGKEFPTIHAGGEVRILNCLPSDPAKLAKVPKGVVKLDPISKIQAANFRPKWLKIKNQGQYGACLPAGTRIRMVDGSQKPIEHVREGDCVLTAEGNASRVTETMTRETSDGLCRLVLWGHKHLRATPNHKLLTRRGYVPIGELTADDWIRMPKYAPATNRIILAADHVQSHRRMFAMAGGGDERRASGYNYADDSQVPDVIELTPGVGRIFGLFLAEGSARDGRVIWSFGAHEEHTLVAELVQLLETELGITSVRVKHRPKQNVINVCVYRTDWGRFFTSLFGTGARDKKLHPDVTAGPHDFLEALLQGWLDGDGYHRRTGSQGVTVSRDLALGMYDIAQALGMCPAISRTSARPTGNVKTRQTRWDVLIPDRSRDTYRCESEDACVWRKVREVVHEDFVGTVYNFEVEGDHSYVAEGVAHKNCVGHGSARGVEFVRALAGQDEGVVGKWEELSAWDVYARLCNGIDSGANILDALTLMSKDGLTLDSAVPHGTINPRKISADAAALRPRFRLEVGGQLNSFEEMAWAAARGDGVVYSVHVGGQFNKLDGDGVPAVQRGFANHCVFAGGELTWSDKWGLMLGSDNSWDVSWGMQGRFRCCDALIQVQSYFEAFAVRAVVIDPEDQPPDAS